MRGTDLFVAATGAWLPARVSTQHAVDTGVFDGALAARTRLQSVAVSQGPSGPQMAAAAAVQALQRADAGPADIDLVLHASAFYQGHEMWAPASYVAQTALGSGCLAMEVRQVSNGAMAALELAGAYLLADPSRSAALITTGDRFCPPGFDRWQSDPGTVYGDGGTALVLSQHDGIARLLSLVTVSAPELEGMHRGDDPFDEAPFQTRPVVDLDTCKRAYLARTRLSFAVSQVSAALDTVVKRALGEAQLELNEIDRFVLPQLGWKRLEAGYLRPLGIDPERTAWSWSRQVGHLGAGDPIAGFDHLASSGVLTPGDRCLLLSVGAGFTWSCAVLEMLAPMPPARVAPAEAVV